jgi:hypothetical protein
MNTTNTEPRFAIFDRAVYLFKNVSSLVWIMLTGWELFSPAGHLFPAHPIINNVLPLYFSSGYTCMFNCVYFLCIPFLFLFIKDQPDNL